MLPETQITEPSELAKMTVPISLKTGGNAFGDGGLELWWQARIRSSMQEMGDAFVDLRLAILVFDLTQASSSSLISMSAENFGAPLKCS